MQVNSKGELDRNFRGTKAQISVEEEPYMNESGHFKPIEEYQEYDEGQTHDLCEEWIDN